MAPKRKTRQLEENAQRAREALDDLLVPSGVPRRGTVLADLIYRASTDARPDGFPTSSAASAPALQRPTSQQALRTGPEDALARKRGHGYAEDSSVEKAVDGICDRACQDCEGGTVRLASGRVVSCRSCQGTGDRFRDPTSEAVGILIDALEEVVRLCVVIDRKRQLVLHARDAAPSEIAAPNCNACHRKVYGGKNDPIRRGVCGACYVAYGRWRIDNGTDDESADRARFCAQRKRHEDHVETTCDQCAENRRKAGDDWRLDHAYRKEQR